MDRLDDILTRYTLDGDDTRGRVTGAAFVVTDENGAIYTGSSGRQDLDPESPPWTDKTFTWVASLTKLATTVSVLQLVEQGRLSLDGDTRPLVRELREARILRGFDGSSEQPVYEDNTRPITLRQLLTHTAGFSYEFADPVLQRWSRTAPGRDTSRIQWSRREVTTPLRFAPGDGWCYGTGVDWAGLVLEAAAGTSLGRHMQTRIFDRLGMADTGFWPGRIAHAAARTAADTRRVPDDLSLAPAPWPTPETHEIESGGSGLFTTAADYARLLAALLARGPLLSEAATAEMLAPQLRDAAQIDSLRRMAFHPLAHNTFAPEFQPGQVLNHALAGMLNAEDVPGKRRAGSIAWSGVLNSRWWLDPKTGIAAVLIVNVRPNGDPVVAALWDELERAVYAHLVGRSVRSNM